MAASSTGVWDLLIEALAGFEKVDTHTLIALVKMAPDNLGNNARDMVSLRVLESLFGDGNEAIVDDDSVRNSRISFDLSERCEDVLHKILSETPGQISNLDKEKWDVGSFLKHKRSSLPKCTLKKILESDHPLVASLKEKSQVIIPNCSENINHDFDVEKDKNESQENVSQESDQVGDSPDLDVEKDENVSQESDQVGDSSGVTTENNEREECETVTGPLLEGSGGKKLMEHDASEMLLEECDDDNLHQDSPTEENGKRISVDNMENLESAVKSKYPQNSTPNASLDSETFMVSKRCKENDG